MRILIVEDQFIEAYDLQLMLERNGYVVTGIAASETEALALIGKDKPDLVCLDIYIKGPHTGIDLAKKLQGTDIGFVFISANSGREVLNEAKTTNPYGFIVKPFREEDILTTLEIASYRHKHNAELRTQHTNLLQQQLELLVKGTGTWPETFMQLGTVLQGYFPFDYLEIRFGSRHETQGILRKNFSEYKLVGAKERAAINPPGKEAFTDVPFPLYNMPTICERADFIEACNASARCRSNAETFGIRGFMVVPGGFGTAPFELYFCNRQHECYNEQHLALCPIVTEGIAKLLETRDFDFGTNIAMPPTPKPQGSGYEKAIGGLVGINSKMLAVYDAAARVAPSDTSVLILGESGTGKEHVARSIHNLSARKDKPFVAINCAAIPQNLAESILFGHEKGAFTGAAERHTGKFELADKGTIFLDEIGEMPIDLQVKLLRVLQENEIERVGGQKPVKINARIIAATNKNLEEEVSAGRFRIDLFYRLYVFPITVPPLRERQEDILPLAEYFINTYSKKLSRKALTLSAHAENQAIAYSWPGNVRQLEHTIQRAIILNDNSCIDELPIPREQVVPVHASGQEFAIDAVKTIQEMERDYIYHILKKCKGKVYGAGGAAELLNLPPSTLNSKMKKLGISTRSI